MQSKTRGNVTHWGPSYHSEGKVRRGKASEDLQLKAKLWRVWGGGRQVHIFKLNRPREHIWAFHTKSCISYLIFPRLCALICKIAQN